MLQEKHPALRDPGPNVGRPNTAFENYNNAPSTVPVAITLDVVEVVASKLPGGARPGGTDTVTLSNWLLRYGEASERLRISLANLGSWLANGNPPWAAYRALQACRLVALDKEPGTRPVGIDETYSHLLAKCVLLQVGHEATHACGSLNLCAGLKAGIEGAVPALQSLWDELSPAGAIATGTPGTTHGASAGHVTTEGTMGETGGPDGTTHHPMAGVTGVNQGTRAGPKTLVGTEAGTGALGGTALGTSAGTRTDSIATSGTNPVGWIPPPAPNPSHSPTNPSTSLLVNARNGFNELSRKAMLWTTGLNELSRKGMLWTTRYLWPSGSRMAFNCYSHSATLILRGRSGNCKFLKLEKGVTQGDPLAMVLYSIALVPLSKNLWNAVPDAVQPWYADDMAIVDTVSCIAATAMAAAPTLQWAMP